MKQFDEVVKPYKEQTQEETIQEIKKMKEVLEELQRDAEQGKISGVTYKMSWKINFM